MEKLALGRSGKGRRVPPGAEGRAVIWEQRLPVADNQETSEKVKCIFQKTSEKYNSWNPQAI